MSFGCWGALAEVRLPGLRGRDRAGTGGGPTDRTRAAHRGDLAHVLVTKFADHLPRYREAKMYGRQDVVLDRSTLADWVGGLPAADRA